MATFATPILNGKLDVWKLMVKAIKTDRKEAFDDFNKRYRIEKHEAWLQATPDSAHLAVVIQEGPGAATFMR